MTDWILILVGFSVVTTVKELKHSRSGNEFLSGMYDLLSFLIMLIATLIAWNGTEYFRLWIWP